VDPLKLIVGLLSNQHRTFSRVRELLERRYGEIDFASSIMDFSHTRYYEKELGTELKRIFFTFKKPLKSENLFKIKLHTRKLESLFLNENNRQVNIDPGYLALDKMVLFTAKNYGHRIYLGRGIFAESTLKYENNTFAPWPWTFPDYKTTSYIKFFNKVRQAYREEISSKQKRVKACA